MPAYETLYDFADRLPRLHFMALAALPALGGLYAVVRHRRGTRDQRQGAWILLAVGLVAGVVIDFLLVREYLRHRAAYRDLAVVEGAVTDLRRESRRKFVQVDFRVDGVPFECREGDLSGYGYCPLEGPVEEGAQVRIGYWPRDGRNLILQLELARP